MMKPASEVSGMFDDVKFNILSVNTFGIDSKVEKRDLDLSSLPTEYDKLCFKYSPSERIVFVRTKHWAGNIDPTK